MGSQDRRRTSGSSLWLLSGLVAALMLATAGSVLAAPGSNNENAKLCKNWSVLYRADGTTFVDRGDCVSYAAEGGVILTSPPTTTTTTTQPPALPYQVVVAAGAAAGTYPAAGAEFGPAPVAVTGSLVLVNDGSASPTQGCSPLVGFPAGSIALADRGGCADDAKVANAQAAGAVAVVVVNNVAGDPTTLVGDNASITIPGVAVSQNSGAIIKAGLPAVGTVEVAP